MKLCASPSVPPTTVNKVLGMIARTKSAKKLNKTLDEVCTELQKIQDQGLAPLLQKVLDAQLAGRTGHVVPAFLVVFCSQAVFENCKPHSLSQGRVSILTRSPKAH